MDNNCLYVFSYLIYNVLIKNVKSFACVGRNKVVDCRTSEGLIRFNSTFLALFYCKYSDGESQLLRLLVV